MGLKCPRDNLKFDLAGVEEVKRKFFGTLYNTYSFFTLYANIDQFKFNETPLPLNDRPEIDRWIISLLNTLVHDVKLDYADYEATNATRKVMNFVDEHLSNWYVRLCRRRFWKGDYSQDKIAAYQTLYECLVTIAKLMAPVAPFFSDWMYKNLNDITKKEGYQSVHLADFPIPNSQLIDKRLEERMGYAQRISSLVRSLRKKENIRVRQPLQKILLPILEDDFEQQVEAVKDLILAEVNVKTIEYIQGSGGIIKKKIKPNFKTLGKRLGPNMKIAAGLINQFTQEDIQKIEEEGKYDLTIPNSGIFTLEKEDFEITTEDIPGWLVASEGGLTVALDITITPSLQAEGLARELVNRIQNITLMLLTKSKCTSVNTKLFNKPLMNFLLISKLRYWPKSYLLLIDCQLLRLSW
jgi:isoleucyl-tRNA synthetase